MDKRYPGVYIQEIDLSTKVPIFEAPIRTWQELRLAVSQGHTWENIKERLPVNTFYGEARANYERACELHIIESTTLGRLLYG